MDGYRKSPIEFSIEDLDRELIARGAQVPDEKKFNFKDAEGTPERDAVMTRAKERYDSPPPPDENLAHISTLDLAKILVFKTRSTLDFTRGFWSEGRHPIIPMTTCIHAAMQTHSPYSTHSTHSTSPPMTVVNAANLSSKIFYYFA